LPALQELLLGVDQRFCVRHIYSNFRKKFPGKNLKRFDGRPWSRRGRKSMENVVEKMKCSGI